MSVLTKGPKTPPVAPEINNEQSLTNIVLLLYQRLLSWRLVRLGQCSERSLVTDTQISMLWSKSQRAKLEKHRLDESFGGGKSAGIW